MTPPARLAAAAGVLDAVLAGAPAERALLAWARGARYAGSGDRHAVRDLVFGALRRRASLAWLGGGATGRGLMIGTLRAAGTDPASLMTGEGHALAPPGPADAGRPLAEAPREVRLDMPAWLLARLDASPDAEAACLALTERAPVFLRVNLRKANLPDVVAALAEDGIEAAPHASVATALRVVAGESRVRAAAAYLDGRVELQDASSQAAVLRLPLRDGERVLDLCAGGGGKTLAMGALASLDLMAHDSDPARMRDLPARARRAGVAVRLIDRPEAAGRFDLVLVDAPCSGSGTWRRAPDAKWRLTPERLDALVALQASLVDQAVRLAGPGGRVAFATCSILREEGPDQVAAALARHDGWHEADRFEARPGPGGDGFFQSILERD